eukprot:3435914-Rhodomonas_salina.1
MRHPGQRAVFYIGYCCSGRQPTSTSPPTRPPQKELEKVLFRCRYADFGTFQNPNKLVFKAPSRLSAKRPLCAMTRRLYVLVLVEAETQQKAWEF